MSKNKLDIKKIKIGNKIILDKGIEGKCLEYEIVGIDMNEDGHSSSSFLTCSLKKYPRGVSRFRLKLRSKGGQHRTIDFEKLKESISTP